MCAQECWRPFGSGKALEASRYEAAPAKSQTASLTKACIGRYHFTSYCMFAIAQSVVTWLGCQALAGRVLSVCDRNESRLHIMEQWNLPDSLLWDVSRSSGSCRALPRQSGRWASGPSRARCPWESPGAAAPRWAPPRSRSGCSRRQARATMMGIAQQACCGTSSCRVSAALSNMHAVTPCIPDCKPQCLHMESAVHERVLYDDISTPGSCLRASLAWQHAEQRESHDNPCDGCSSKCHGLSSPVKAPGPALHCLLCECKVLQKLYILMASF